MKVEIVNRETGEAIPLLKVKAVKFVIDEERHEAVGTYEYQMPRFDFAGGITRGGWERMRQIIRSLPSGRTQASRAHRKKLKRGRRR
jgi:hypothetical protein